VSFNTPFLISSAHFSDPRCLISVCTSALSPLQGYNSKNASQQDILLKLAATLFVFGISTRSNSEVYNTITS